MWFYFHGDQRRKPRAFRPERIAPLPLGRADFHQHTTLAYLTNIWSTGCMRTVLTAKLKLHTTPAQFRALRQTQLAYRDALNYVSRYPFAHGKLSNPVGLQDCVATLAMRTTHA